VRRAAEQATFRDVFAVSEFRALWLAQILSVVGDQLARVALTILVYYQTRSALLAAITFACSVFPAFIGGITLSGLADRFPRRTVMITCDVIRAILVVVMAIPGWPLGGLVVLLFLVTLIGAPFLSARAAVYPDVLPGEQYVLGTAITQTTFLFAQVIGFAASGAVVAVFGVRTSLRIDAATFVASAVLVRLWVRARPPADTSARRRRAPFAAAASGARLVFGTPALRVPMLLGWLAAFYDVPEGVATPLATSLHRGPVTVGLILAAGAFGASVGMICFTRLVPPGRRLRLMRPLAACCCAVLVLMAAKPALPLTLLILSISGLLACYQTAANAAFVAAAPPHQRSQAFGLAQGGINLGQGAAMILAGAATQYAGPAVVIAVSGAIGTISALTVTLSNPSH
jgi:MFS family permease